MSTPDKGYRTVDRRYAEDFAPPRKAWRRELAVFACTLAVLAGLLTLAARDAGGWGQLYNQVDCFVFHDDSACDRIFSDTGGANDLDNPGLYTEEPGVEYGQRPLPSSETLP